MKKAFTLIELLIVVSIIATLMTITFRIGSTTADEQEKRDTVLALQKLENCLSGYNAAFGSYPPVKVYGTRNIYAEVEENVQQEGDESSNKELRWDQIKAACRSQPIDSAFPFDEKDWTRIERLCKDLQKILNDGKHGNWDEDNPYMANAIRATFHAVRVEDVNSNELWGKDSWTEVQIFKFGLLSYLLPRYLTMMSGDEEFYGANGTSPCAQWSVNNDKCISVEDGKTEFTWRDTYEYVNNKKGERYYAKIANLPAQAVCARWIANLEGLCAATTNEVKLFGVNIASEKSNLCDTSECRKPGRSPPPLNIYSPGGKGGNYYLLNTITVNDGWGQPIYYYTPNGAQSYTLWSGGANKLTFPPWLDASGLMDELIRQENGESKTVAEAIADDIVRMRN